MKSSGTELASEGPFFLLWPKPWRKWQSLNLLVKPQYGFDEKGKPASDHAGGFRPKCNIKPHFGTHTSISSRFSCIRPQVQSDKKWEGIKLFSIFTLENNGVFKGKDCYIFILLYILCYIYFWISGSLNCRLLSVVFNFSYLVGSEQYGAKQYS